MEAVIVNFRSGRHTQKDNHMILKVAGVENKEKAAELIGKKVVFTTSSGKELKGEVKSAHGNKGAVRAIFETGMPGQSVGKKVKIE
ncbi:50S ribosomal protein L35ae [Candidatus Woesearchaeota archaeon]|nr:50S ribosomal protein L35ae [Candidatus Woesearchaeota archaeon]